MRHKKILSAALAAAMLLTAVPAITNAEGEDMEGSVIIDKAPIPEDATFAEHNDGEVTFTEYNDKEGEMYNVVGRNRLDARTDSAIPYQSEEAAVNSAVNYAKETSNRVKMLTGEDASNQWDMTVVKNLEMGAERGLINETGTENPFAESDYVQTGDWKTNVKMPSSWTSYGDWWNNHNTPNGENETWVWDYPIYDNVKMPWQSGEQPYDSDDPYTGTYGTLTPGEAPVKYNPIGFYRTTINTAGLEMDADDRVRISFQGVESAYYVFIDGQVIGYSEDSYRPHEFDITDYVSDGADHTLAVRVHKFNDGTWLEDQDMIYDGGIFRDVFLISVPAVSVEDYKIDTDFDENYVNADLIIRDLRLKNNTDEDIPAGYTVTANLYDKEDTSAIVKTITFTTDQAIPAGKELMFGDKSVFVESPKQWSAEKPNLYVLSFNLADNSGSEVMSAAQLVGFREIEYTANVDTDNAAQTEATYYTIKINGQPLLMKGVNRHDADPLNGKYVSKELYDIDLQTMKQYNINTIRTSHYANDEYLYYLTDTYGFYVMAETNAECHAVAQRDRTNYEVYNTILGNIFKDRTITSYQTLKNHSSIVSWSIGNECGAITNENSPIYYWMTNYFHNEDPTRFVHSEFMQWDEHTDTESNMYPTVEKTQNMAVNPDMPAKQNTAGKPFFLCEYVHAMGNAMGDLEGYWDAIRSGENMIGGCIWDWVDQSRIVPLERVTNTDDNTVKKTDSNSNIVPDPYDYYADGKYLAHENLFGKLREGYFFGYGGDWGDINFEGRNVAADGTASGGGRGSFSGNGLVSPDRQPQPEIYEVKYQYQSFWFKETPIYTQKQLENGWTTDENLKNQQVAVYNENNFTNLNEYDINWTLTENGQEIGSGPVENVPSVEPKQAGTIAIPYAQYLPDTLMAGGEYRLYVEVVTKEDSWGVNAGHEIAHEQFDLSDEVLETAHGAAPAEPVPAETGGEGLSVTEDADKFMVEGDGFSFEISKKTGFLSNYVYNGETLIHQLKPNYYRDAHANDSPQIDNWKFADEEQNIIPVTNTIKCTQDADGRYVIDVGLKIKVPYEGDEYAKELLRYIVDQSGAVTYRMYLDTTNMPNQTAGGRYILRLGSEMKLDEDFENITWYGNGIETGTDGEYGYNYPVPESYRERDSFAVKGIYSSTATDMFFPHFDTQETGTVNDVTWAAMDNGTTAILASANKEYKGKETDPNWEASDKNALEVSALHYSTKDLRNGSMHPYELVSTDKYTMEEGYTYFNIDHKSLGIGNSSCGPTQREDARIYTGYIYDYEYTFKPMSIDSTNDSYIAESIALNAVAPTEIADPEFSKEIGIVGYTTPELGLPETVTVDGEEHSVVWDVTIDDCEVYEDTLITGTIDDGSVVEGTICVYPDNMYYFVDCNDSDASVFEGVQGISDTLVNTVNDQTSVNNGWGLSSAEGTYGNPAGAGVAAGNKYTTGWYAEKNQSIEYQFTLEPGRYSVTAGFGEFWPTNRARAMTVTVTNAAGETLGSADAALNAQADPQVLRDKAEIGFELTEQTVINISVSKAHDQDPVLSWIGIAQALPQAITAQEGITASMSEAYEGETVTLSGNFAKNSLFVTDESGELSEVTYNEDGTASFTMPKKAVSVTGLVNTDTVTYVVPDTIERVRGGSETDNRNYFIAGNRALGMTFSIPAGTYESAKLHFTRQNSAPGQLTNLYDQTEHESFVYENSDGYIAQYNGNTQTGLELGAVESNGVYKILLAYDSSVSSSASGNDYYVVGANSNGTVSPNQLPKNVSQLPYLELSVDAASIKYGIVSDGNIEITSSAAEGETVIFEEPENFVEKSLIISYKNGDKTEFVDAEKDGNTYSFTMPAAEISISCLVNTDTTIYVIPDTVRVNGPSQNDNRNYFVAYDRALGMTFDIPAGSYTEAKLNFVRENTAPPRTTNIYDQTAAEGFTYEDGEGYITQYDGRTQHGLALGTVPTAGIFKLLLAYDSSVDSGAAGNDYYVAGATAENKLPRNASELPYIELSVDTSAVTRISSVTADAQEYTEGSVIPNGAEITDVTIEGAVEAGTTVYAALYSDGVLMAVSSGLAVEGTSSMLNDTIKVPDSGSYELKVFAWNDNMVPQADAFTAAAGE